MRAAFRFVTTVIGLILIGLSVLILLLAGPFSHFAAALVARDLSTVYGTQVTLADCKFRPFQQRIELQGLTINNPDPFRTGPAMVAERVDIDLDAPAFLSGSPTARRVLFAGLTVHLQHESGQGTNLGRLAGNARAFAAERREQAGTDGEPRGLRVETLRTEGTILRAGSSLAPNLDVPLPINDFEVDRVSERGALVRGEILQLLIQSLLLEATGIPGVIGEFQRVLRGEAAESAP